ncbi:MAG: flagellar motor protein [Thermoleophilia bacterium]|jgi:chemotaxis protein MotA
MSVIIGLALAWVLIVVGMLLKGGTIIGIVNLPAFLMVMGGTFGALIASYGLKSVTSMFSLMKTSMKEPPDTRPQIIEQLVGYSEKARREGLLVLEDDARNAEDPYLARGVRLVVDGTDPELVKDIMETELDAMEERHKKNQQVFVAGGGFAPTIGILATVLSLVSVLQHLDKPDTLGPAISAAFLATFYGVAVANIFFYPVGNALKSRTEQEVSKRTLMIEGVLSIQSGDNPRVLAEKLWSFLPADQRPANDAADSSSRAGASERSERMAKAA